MKSYNISEPLPFPYEFETLIEVDAMRSFLRKRWHYSIYISIVYLIVIFLLREYMKTRPAYDLKRASVFWNGILAIYSIFSALRGMPIMYFGFTRFPFYYIICDKSLAENLPQLIFWGTTFLFSKIWELGDTILIILRKRKLMFLHWYHHVATFVGMWYGAHREASFGSLLCYTNVVVHSFMYSYFALKSMDIKIPIFIAMFITAIQTLQMLFGVLLSFWVYWLLINGYECDTPKDALEYIFVMYFSYLILFSYLFYDSYIRPVFSHKKKD
ncbi:putative fatty acid elongase 3 [Centruroides vittatus]|uniref:putative fatty acid elongase 3 n=1 Tax=Centruroides vittatus TaxID=120091 RepID=UPI00351019D4